MTRIVDPLLKRSKVLELHYINYQLIKSLYEYKLDKKKSYQIKTQSRSSIILPYFNNLIVYVYKIFFFSLFVLLVYPKDLQM